MKIALLLLFCFSGFALKIGDKVQFEAKNKNENQLLSGKIESIDNSIYSVAVDGLFNKRLNLTENDFIPIPIINFFKNPIGFEDFAAKINHAWKEPVVSIPEKDLERINETKSKVLAYSYDEYLKLSNALTNNKVFPYHTLGFNEKDMLDSNWTAILNDHMEYKFFKNEYSSSFVPVTEQLILAQKTFLNIDKSKDEVLAFKDIILKNIDSLHWRNIASESDFPFIYGNSLTIHIANTNTDNALLFIDAGANINTYAPSYGNNPILLSIAKGINHKATDNPSDVQSSIINKLLEHPNLDINAIDLRNGFTVLHIACVRRDEPEFIKKLLDKGADPSIRDFQGRTAESLLHLELFKEAQKMIGDMTDANFENDSNHSFTATLPTKKEWEQRKEAILEIFHPKS